MHQGPDTEIVSYLTLEVPCEGYHLDVIPHPPGLSSHDVSPIGPAVLHTVSLVLPGIHTLFRHCGSMYRLRGDTCSVCHLEFD